MVSARYKNEQALSEYGVAFILSLVMHTVVVVLLISEFFTSGQRVQLIQGVDVPLNAKILTKLSTPKFQEDLRKEQEQLVKKEKEDLKKKAEEQKHEQETQKQIKEKREREAVEKIKHEQKIAADNKKKVELAEAAAKKKRDDAEAKREKEAERKEKELADKKLKAKELAEKKAKQKEADDKKIADLLKTEDRKQRKKDSKLPDEPVDAPRGDEKADPNKFANENEKWKSDILTHIKLYYGKPEGVPADALCTLAIRQTRNGVVTNVGLENCNAGATDAFRLAVRTAVSKAGKLPRAPLDEIFDPVVRFNFRPE